MRVFLSLLKNYISYFLWILRGRKYPPMDILYKRKRLKKLGKKFNCDSLIETGTYNGKTIFYLRKRFKKIMSVEVYKPCYQDALKRVQRFKNIELFYGDSRQQLPIMIVKIEGRCLFWLDGHYSGSGTGMSESECPVIEELIAIKEAKRKDHLILIDDAREFKGGNDYPPLHEVLKLLYDINQNYSVEIKEDCIIATI
jgi:hypothetical protein